MILSSLSSTTNIGNAATLVIACCPPRVLKPASTELRIAGCSIARSDVEGIGYAFAEGMSGVWAGAVVRDRGGMGTTRWCSEKDGLSSGLVWNGFGGSRRGDRRRSDRQMHMVRGI